MDPTTWVLFITFVLLPIYFTLSKNFSNYSLEQKEKQQLESVKFETSERYYCTVYETHLFEKKLADAGILKREEITICDNQTCELCKDERIFRSLNEKRKWERSEIEANPTEWERFQNLKKFDPRWKGYSYKDYKFQQWLKGSSEPEPRVVETHGYRFPVPEQVPEYAEVNVIESGGGDLIEAIYTWYQNGKTMSLRQPVSIPAASFKADTYYHEAINGGTISTGPR